MFPCLNGPHALCFTGQSIDTTETMPVRVPEYLRGAVLSPSPLPAPQLLLPSPFTSPNLVCLIWKME